MMIDPYFASESDNWREFADEWRKGYVTSTYVSILFPISTTNAQIMLEQPKNRCRGFRVIQRRRDA
jgi:hypothetical protein